MEVSKSTQVRVRRIRLEVARYALKKFWLGHPLWLCRVDLWIVVCGLGLKQHGVDRKCLSNFLRIFLKPWTLVWVNSLG